MWILTRGRVVVQRDDSGDARRMSGTSSDITALKQAEGRYRHQRGLESRVEQRTRDLQMANIELRGALERLHQAQRQLLEAEKFASLAASSRVWPTRSTPVGVGATAASPAERRGAFAARRKGAPDALGLERFVRALQRGRI